ncbi:NAD-dependent epimerase/dehydratase family protein [Microbulbifer bruguierae]|uniref:NAD-dependent epimerase/dehydratase family protein n=1 Tax=Microbulbifer bruguierae TaxID=3029061 RepID=A0ABY8NDW2_9GAMM|nr:NAD-dependent epimerase/dehydratase family protein [Microbulbifer bruguierae]WGL17093.1 NAD-dependent epimerase/dehydratase family protein [Microbulbifer bruguierae]
MNLMIVGATGLVGRHVLDLALANTAVHRVIAPTRRPLPAHPKLLLPQVDFEQLPDGVDWWQVDAVICALGTTMRIAGSRIAFTRVDHDYPLEVARLTHRAGASVYVLNSALGADPDSRFFYNRTKGKLEYDLKQIGFESLAFVRPGLIGGNREEFRPGERMAELLLRLMHPLIPRRWRISPAQNIARELLGAALKPEAGIRIVSSQELTY